MQALYLSLDLPPEAAGLAVIRTAARALHPLLRANPDLRLARRRFYREMLNEHDLARARQTAGRKRSRPANPPSRS